MWKKTLGVTLLLLLVSVMLQGCYSSRRAYYRDGFAPSYVNVRVRHGHRPSYRVYRHRYHDGHHYRKYKNRHHDRDRDWRHHHH